MPSFTQTNPSNPVVPYVTPDSSSNINSKTQQRRSNIAAQWGTKAVQTVPHGLTGGSTWQDIGYDTGIYNTYQQLAGNVYNLQFIDETIGGNSYPFTSVSVPDFGYYLIQGSLEYTKSTSGEVTALLAIWVNGNPITINSAYGNTNSESLIVTVSDVLQLNPNDTFVIRLLLEGTSTFVTAAQPFDCFMNLRYLGVS